MEEEPFSMFCSISIFFSHAKLKEKYTITISSTNENRHVIMTLNLVSVFELVVAVIYASLSCFI